MLDTGVLPARVSLGIVQRNVIILEATLAAGYGSKELLTLK